MTNFGDISFFSVLSWQATTHRLCSAAAAAASDDE